MRVVVLFEYASLNGGERSWLASASYLRSHDVELCAIGPASGELAEALAEAEIEHIVWPSGVRDDNGIKRSQEDLRRQLGLVLGASPPDLVHANSLSMARTLGPLATRLNVPCIGHIRDILRLNKKAIRDLNQNHRLLAVSEATRRFHIDQGMDADRTSVLYNGVDLELFRPAAPTGRLHRELGISAASRLILTIGQIGMRKGLDDAISALKRLFEVDRNLHWIVVGLRYSTKTEAIRYAESLVERSSRPPFAGRVHWLGRRDDVSELLCESTLVLHTAKQEPLGRVLLEAAASGRPIVATRVGGTTEILGDGSGAVATIVPAGDRELVSTAVEALLADDAYRKRLGLAARQRMEALFSAESAASSLLHHYRELVAQGPEV